VAFGSHSHSFEKDDWEVLTRRLLNNPKETIMKVKKNEFKMFLSVFVTSYKTVKHMSDLKASVSNHLNKEISSIHIKHGYTNFRHKNSFDVDPRHEERSKKSLDVKSAIVRRDSSGDVRYRRQNLNGSVHERDNNHVPTEFSAIGKCCGVTEDLSKEINRNNFERGNDSLSRNDSKEFSNAVSRVDLNKRIIFEKENYKIGEESGPNSNLARDSKSKVESRESRAEVLDYKVAEVDAKQLRKDLDQVLMAGGQDALRNQEFDEEHPCYEDSKNLSLDSNDEHIEMFKDEEPEGKGQRNKSKEAQKVPIDVEGLKLSFDYKEMQDLQEKESDVQESKAQGKWKERGQSDQQYWSKPKDTNGQVSTLITSNLPSYCPQISALNHQHNIAGNNDFSLRYPTQNTNFDSRQGSQPASHHKQSNGLVSDKKSCNPSLSVIKELNNIKYFSNQENSSFRHPKVIDPKRLFNACSGATKPSLIFNPKKDPNQEDSDSRRPSIFPEDSNIFNLSITKKGEPFTFNEPLPGSQLPNEETTSNHYNEPNSSDIKQKLSKLQTLISRNQSERMKMDDTKKKLFEDRPRSSSKQSKRKDNESGVKNVKKALKESLVGSQKTKGQCTPYQNYLEKIIKENDCLIEKISSRIIAKVEEKFRKSATKPFKHFGNSSKVDGGFKYMLNESLQQYDKDHYSILSKQARWNDRSIREGVVEGKGKYNIRTEPGTSLEAKRSLSLNRSMYSGGNAWSRRNNLQAMRDQKNRSKV
jgi:hypothetical protein